ncbi:MAG: DUF2203 domain-containing protein [Gemmatimonadetes bacterium]|nr:DUF2203 domain-containing protein [Gemmatimonadota bacterium]
MSVKQDRPRFFTVEEANRTLPLVRRIVQDIVHTHGHLQPRIQELQQLTADARTPPARALVMRREIEAEGKRIDEFVAELQQLGCVFKGFDLGLVDFYTLYGGRPVFLCWKLGEERVEHWHDLESGYTGRQPLTPAMEEEIRKALRPRRAPVRP